MLNIRSLELSSLLAVGFLAVSGCALAPPRQLPNTGGGGTSGAMCVDDVDGGADGGGDDDGGDASDDGGADGGNNIDNVVTPMACVGSGPNPNAIDKYSQGYTPDPMVLARVQSELLTITIPDEAAQMRGLAITPFYAPTNNIERSEDTSSIRGFRYRDASRGMDLGEDFSGTYPKAAVVAGSDVGYSTAFPVSMARGAAFDLDLEYAIGEAIGDEMQAAKETLLLAPCMNALRHPLWGRAQETYGEDSFQIGRLASAMVVGIQQHIAANAKHFMAYNIENNRAANNSQMDEQTLRETFGRHFRMVVQDSGVSSVMASYNLVNKTKSTQNKHTLTEVLRNDFGFKGFVLSDWWAMPNTDPKAADATTLKRTAVEAVQAGLDVELPWGLNFQSLEDIATTPGSGLTKDDLDRSVARILEQKYRFNADGLAGNVGLTKTTRTQYSDSRISCDGSHLALAEKAALESMVLLKNDGDTLPIKPSVTKVAVIGASVPFRVTDGATQNKNNTRTVHFATDVTTGDLGSSRVFPDPDKSIGPFAGICAAAGGTPNMTALTCDGSPSISFTTATNNVGDTSAALSAARDADFVVVVAGLTAEDEGEEYTGAGDRLNLRLDGKQTDPAYQGIQDKLIADVAALGKPMVVVLEGGSVIAMPWLSTVPAVVMAWYPGQRGGAALGKLLFGNVGGKTYNFSGKLPFTWGSSLDQYQIFDGKGTTPHDYYIGYHHFDKEGFTPLFAFGEGLSYTKFEYRKLQLGCSDMSKGAVLPVVVNVANTGNVDGDETVMVFVAFPNTTAKRRFPRELKGFARVHLAAGEEKQITIPVRLADLDYFQTDAPTDTATTGKWVVENGDITIMVGGSSTSLPRTATVTVHGY